MRKLAALGALLFGLVACTGDDVPSGPPASATSSATSSTSTTATTSSTPSSSAPSSTAPTPTPTVNPPSSTRPPTSTTTPSPTPTSAPTTTPPTTPHGRTYPKHNSIISTSFWVGELYDVKLADGSQVCSTYDSQWAYHWSGVNTGKVPSSAPGCGGSILGGCDGTPGPNGTCKTEARTAGNGYFPTKVQPRENPFYLDLPFDDINDTTAFRTRCQVIPWAGDPGYAGRCKDTRFSFMKNRWVKIQGPSGRICYGQIQDAGPSHGSLYHDANYVFGTQDARPAQTQFNRAGMDVSPALNGCLGFRELDGQNDLVSWWFADDVDVPAGPWRKVITTSGVTP